MEILTVKKVFFIIAITMMTFSIHLKAQTSRQTAFYKSYEAEKGRNYATAIAELKKTYKADDYFVNIRLGWLNYLAKQYAESQKFYQISINLKPYSIEAHFGMIKPLSAIENWERVKQEYLSILKIDPQNTLANYWLGVIYYNRKDYNTAMKLFEKVINLYPLDYDTVIMLAWTKLNLGKMAEAKILFDHALTLKPGDESATNGMKLIK